MFSQTSYNNVLFYSCSVIFVFILGTELVKRELSEKKEG